jgi:hypothetical protein
MENSKMFYLTVPPAPDRQTAAMGQRTGDAECEERS